MAAEKTVRVCRSCSNIDVKALRDKAGRKNCSFGCVGRCQERNPQLKGKVCGYINGEFVVCEKQSEFFERIDVLFKGDSSVSPVKRTA